MLSGCRRVFSSSAAMNDYVARGMMGQTRKIRIPRRIYSTWSRQVSKTLQEADAGRGANSRKARNAPLAFIDERGALFWPIGAGCQDKPNSTLMRSVIRPPRLSAGPSSMSSPSSRALPSAARLSMIRLNSAAMLGRFFRIGAKSLLEIS